MFKEEDVIKVAKAMVESHREFVNDHNNGDYSECIHCYAETCREPKGNAPITHALDCPVLVAQDLLTGVTDATTKR